MSLRILRMGLVSWRQVGCGGSFTQVLSHEPDYAPQRVAGEVERPALVRTLRQRHLRARAQQGKPVSLILDDPLVYSDDGRLDTMIEILTEVADRMQVILLTCRDRAFRHVSGNRIAVRY